MNWAPALTPLVDRYQQVVTAGTQSYSLRDKRKLAKEVLTQCPSLWQAFELYTDLGVRRKAAYAIVTENLFSEQRMQRLETGLQTAQGAEHAQLTQSLAQAVKDRADMTKTHVDVLKGSVSK